VEFIDLFAATENQHAFVTSNENVCRFLAGPTEAALLADCTVRGFAISFSTARRVASLNALLFFFGGITSSWHVQKSENGQFRPTRADSEDASQVE
jgi:hypothetical protein